MRRIALFVAWSISMGAVASTRAIIDDELTPPTTDNPAKTGSLLDEHLKQDVVLPALVGVVGDSIKVVAVPPLAIRSGVLMIGLARTDPTVQWPESIDLQLDNGRIARGRVALLEEMKDRAAPTWTDPPAWFEPMIPSADSKSNEAILLVRIPLDAPDVIRLGTLEWTIRLVDPIAPGDLGIRGTPNNQIPQSHRYNEAEPRCGAEHIRSRLAARGAGEAVAPMAGRELDRLYAEAVADRWDASLATLAKVDPLSAERIVQSIGGFASGVSATGEAIEIAAWETDPIRLDSLLNKLESAAAMDDAHALSTAAVQWLSAASPVAAWIERETDSAIVLGVLNGGFESVYIEASWIGGSANGEAYAIPAAAGSYQTVEIDRSAEPSNTESEAPILFVQTGSHDFRLAMPPAVVPATPPAIDFGLFVRELTLSDGMAGQVRIAPSEWATHALLRRRPFGWELLIESARPVDDAGRDEIEIRIGSGGAGRFRVTEAGVLQIDRSPNADTPTLRAVSSKHSWSAAIAIPESWMGGHLPPVGTLVHIGIMRRIAALGRFTPLRALAPWNETGHELRVDVGAWPSTESP